MAPRIRMNLSIPEDTARVARQAFPKGNVYMRMRDELGPLYRDSEFAELFSNCGPQGVPPGLLALVTVMQYAEGLSDRQAAEQVRARIDWKYALGLELTDAGFDYSVLSEFRSRLIRGSMEEKLLNDMLAAFRERGWLKAGGRQRTDSTHVLAAIRTLNRLECVGETMRHALNALAVVAPDWLKAWVPTEWVDRYARRFEQYRLPDSKAKRQSLAETIGTDGSRLLEAIYAPAAPTWLRHVPAVEILRQVWVQQYEVHDGQIRWRTAGNLPPARLMIQSPYDPEAHYSSRRSTTWTGYMVHVTETCDDDKPHLITHVETVPAPEPDSEVTETVHVALADKDLTPGQHLVDSGYVDAEQLVEARQTYQIDLVGPVNPDTSWQGRTPEAYDLSQFVINWEAESATCPHGHISQVWSSSHDSYGNAVVHVRFGAADCRACPARQLCTRSKDGPRSLQLRSQAQHIALQEARHRQTTEAFKQIYAIRAGIEGTLSQGARSFGLRRARYIGLAKAHLQHVITAAAIDLARIAAWLEEIPLATTRTSRFVALMVPT